MGSKPLPHDPRRRHERHFTDNVSCDVGDVVDMSASGMRVACRGRPPMREGQVAKMVLAFTGGKINLQIRVVWIKRKGLRRAYEIGLHFINVTPKLTAALDSIAHFGFIGPDTSTANGATTNSTRSRQRVRASVELPDYYQVLEVGHSASHQEIREAFHKLALTCHPDVNKDPESQQRFVQIKEAYEVLRDPSQRESYDMRRAG